MSKIQQLKTSELNFYHKNPRQGDIEAIKKSLIANGQYKPIVVNKGTHTNRPLEVLAGNHTLKAARKLGWETIECYIIDVDNDHAQRIVLADNRTADLGTYDDEVIAGLLQELDDIDGTGYDYDDLDNLIKDITQDTLDPIEPTFHRERTGNQYNLDLYDPTKTTGIYNMPTLEPSDHIPPDLIGFNYAKNNTDKTPGIHFFIDDYQFERTWNNPPDYLDVLKQYDSVLTPDFSLYLDMPAAMKIWNTYRSRLVGQYWQTQGLTVIPTVSWAEPDSYTYCFDGLPKNATLAISTVGVKTNPISRHTFHDGLTKMIETLTPKTLLIYGDPIEHDYKNTVIHHYKNHVTTNLKRSTQ